MKGYLQKGEIGTIIAISVLVIVGISSLVSSVFLSKKQITSSRAGSNSCVSVVSCNLCPNSKVCNVIPNSGGAEWDCCDRVPTATPTKSPSPTPDPCIANPLEPCGLPTSSPKKCNKTGRYNVGKCGEIGCSPDKIFKCDWYTKDNLGTCGGNNCKCEPDASCITPIPTLSPTDVPADTGLGTGSGDQTGTAYCPDGGIRDSNENNSVSCDYGKESAGNTTYYIDQNNPQCAGCVWTNYSGSFPYGQCHYANSSVCRRSDNVGGCAGVCNAACCSDNSLKENGEVYDQSNPPGSGGGEEEFTDEYTADQDIILTGEKICDGSIYLYCDQDKCVQSVPPESCSK